LVASMTATLEEVEAMRSRLYLGLVRALKQDSQAATLLVGPPKAQDGLAQLASALQQLMDTTSKRLLTTRNELKDAATEMRNKLARTDNAERELALLQDELKKQRAARERKAADLDALLTKLTVDEARVQASAAADLQAVQATGQEATTYLTSSHRVSAAALATELDRLTAEHKALVDAHGEAEATLRKRRARAAEEASEARREYDSAMQGRRRTRRQGGRAAAR
jgi:hypothetical protein